MNITEIISVSPINPAHGRHEIHAITAEGCGVALTISRDALGCLTAHFEATIPPDAAYMKWVRKQEKETAKSSSNKGS